VVSGKEAILVDRMDLVAVKEDPIKVVKVDLNKLVWAVKVDLDKAVWVARVDHKQAAWVIKVASIKARAA
jgi:hypothetical protein